MSKPTPGPYTIGHLYLKERDSNGDETGPVVNTVVVTVPHDDDTLQAMAYFIANDEFTLEQCEANARAWVDGMAAMEKLRRMRALYVDKRDDELFSVAIEVKHILDEP